MVVVELTDGEHTGRGEAAGVYYLGDDSRTSWPSSRRTATRSRVAPTGRSLRELMPRGGARNAVDCAMWELEAKRDGREARQLAGVDEPKPLVTTFTLGADDPAAMAEGARRYADARAIKVKLTGELDLDIERVRAIRAARPDVWLGVDANQGYSRDDARAARRGAVAQRVALLEQPLRARPGSRSRRLSLRRSRLPPMKALSGSRRCPAPSAASTSSTSSSTNAAA